MKLTPRTPWTAADLHNDGFDDPIVLTQDGTPYEVNNKPYGAAGKTTARKSR